MVINMSLEEFLVQAKKNTYASSNNYIDASRMKSKDLLYKEDNYTYLDSYFGDSDFSGEEVVYREDVPIWSMNYIGRVTDDKFKSEVLKQALQHVEVSMPYRGPRQFVMGEYTYVCDYNGDINWFTGEEKILYKQLTVYELRFHGGKII